MKKKEFVLKNSQKATLIMIIALVIIGLLLIDFIDVNEKFGFPISVMDEPLMILFGVILGYLIAKFRFIRILKKEFEVG
jgi:uncharacterized membrane protein YwzB